MLNTQSPENQLLLEDGRLSVHSIWSTIQGEGPYAGMPAVFIRLAGCNLRCPMCDTDYTTVRASLSVTDVLQAVKGIAGHSRLVVLTGGEPFRQNIGPLCEALLDNHFVTQVETNGMLALPEFPYRRVTIVVSPKTSKINEKIAQFADAWKYVVEANHVDEQGFPTRVLGIGMRVARPSQFVNSSCIYVQPLDSQNTEQNAANEKEAVRVCLTHGFRLCLQIHKIVGVA